MTLREAEAVGRLRRLGLSQTPSGPAIPYVSDRAIDEPQPNVRRAVLVVHGTERDGPRYWRALARAARRAGPEIRAETLLVAPQFLTRRDARAQGLGPDIPVWSKQAWKAGEESRSGDRISSFVALDAILTRLADTILFPALERVVLVGHSAGAQLVQRYAAASLSEDRLRDLERSVRYVVVNPSSYLYLDGARPGFGEDGGLGLPPEDVRQACPDYNRYKYGLEDLNPYLEAIGGEEIRRRYAEKEIVYLLGADDDDPAQDTLDRSCPALLQGPTRLARGTAFMRHLADIYGERVRERHVLEILPRLGHQGARILRSDRGLRWIFDVEHPPTIDLLW